MFAPVLDSCAAMLLDCSVLDRLGFVRADSLLSWRRLQRGKNGHETQQHATIAITAAAPSRRRR